MGLTGYGLLADIAVYLVLVAFVFWLERITRRPDDRWFPAPRETDTPPE